MTCRVRPSPTEALLLSLDPRKAAAAEDANSPQKRTFGLLMPMHDGSVGFVLAHSIDLEEIFHPMPPVMHELKMVSLKLAELVQARTRVKLQVF